MNLKKEKVLLTGGCGFIGSHTALILLELGFDLIIIDSNINSSSKVIDRICKIIFKEYRIDNNRFSFYQGDLRDKLFIENIFDKENSKESKISFVIHFAGLKSVRESNIVPLNYWDANVSGTIQLLDVMMKHNCKNLIFSSSATVYEASANESFSENDNINPSNPYGNTKITIEKLLRDIFDSDINGWRIACLRYFNPIGAHPSGLLGEDPSGNPNNIFPIILNVAIGNDHLLEIYGSDWDTSDGTCIRDYIHVMDVAEGHIKTFEYLLNNNAQFLNLNIGTGKGTSVLELVNTFEQINNLKVPFKFSERRKGDLKKVIADSSLSFSLLGWRPKRSTKEMCRDGWKWKISNPDGYK